ncbi:zinc ribbon domain-containing protein [Bacillus sp. V59.32b]|uniref:zinc ribbon domain-containing protein n=1 Tax=Bacillus sp. V59.32b TaxID=1758642 RepID=UPI0013585CCC|nr:zinc-ribbon domain-containing protein [Bacillus sp. V59.32b]
MNYCKECGTQLNDSQTFCSNCGAQQPEPASDAPASPTRNKKRSLSGKAKAGIITAVILVASLAGSHFYLSSLTDPMKTVEEFEKAVKDDDTKALAKIINQGQDKHTITEKEAASYLAFLTDDNDFNDISKELKRQAYEIDGYKVTEAVKDGYNNKLVSVKKEDKKKWLLYDDYFLEFYPIELVVSSNLEDTEVSLAGKKTKTLKEEDEDENLGYIFPGEHILKAVYKGEYAELTSEDELDFSDAYENELVVDIEIDSTSLYLYSNDDDAVLFVNGKSTGEKIADMDSFGPVATDGSIKLHAERKVDGKTEKTEVFKVNDDSDVELLFEEEETAEVASTFSDLFEQQGAFGDNEIGEFMDKHFTDQVAAINARDFSLGASTIDPKGPSYEETRKYIDTLEKKGITEEYHGLSSIDSEEVDGGYNVTTEESYIIHYDDGTSKYKKFRSKFFLTLTEDGLKVNKLLDTEEIESNNL